MIGSVQARIAFALLLAGACRRSEVEPAALDLEAGELAVLALGDAEGNLRAGTVTTLEEPALRLAREEGDVLYAWILRPGTDLVAPSDLLAGMRVRIAGKLQPRAGVADDARSGACGRCLVPPLGAPKLVLAGESCPLGSLGRSRVFGASNDGAAARAAAAIAVELPGDCPCAIGPDPSVARARDASLIDPPVEGWPVEAATCAPDGSVALFSQRYARLYRGPGDVVNEVDEPFETIVTGAEALDDGTFFVVSQSQNRPSFAPLITRFDADLRQIYSAHGPNMFTLRTRRVANDPRVMMIGGDCVIGCVPAVRACEVVAETVRCDQLTPEGNRVAYSPVMVDFAALDGGLFAALRADGAIALVRAVATGSIPCGENCVHDGLRDLHWTGFASPSVPASELRSGAHLAGIGGIAAAGDRLYACAHDELSSPSDVAATIVGAVITADLVRAGEAPQLPFRAVAGPFPGVECRSLVNVAGIRSATIAAVLSDGAVVELVGDGDYGLPGKMSGMARSGCLLAKNADDRWARFLPGAGGPEVVYGPDRPEPRPARSVAGFGDEFWIFRDGGEVSIVYPDRRVENLTLGSVPAGVVARDGDELVIAADRIVRVARDRTLREVAALPELARGIATTAPAEQVLITAGDRIFRLRGDALEEVVVDWDDPNTVALESPPPASSCPELLRSVDASSGVAWVGGCGGVILRVDAAGAHRIAMSRLPPDEVLESPAGPTFTAVRALCADRAIFGARAPDGLDTDARRGWFLDVRPEGPLATYGPNAVSVQGQFYVQAPIALVGDTTSLSAVFAAEAVGSYHPFGSTQRVFFPRPFIAAAANDSGAVLAISESERLVLFEP